MNLRRAITTRRDRGVALITAMLISAIATMVAANLAWDNALDVRRTLVNLGRDQAVQVALGAESWIISILRQDGGDNATDHLGEVWASELPGLPIEGGEVFGNIEDLQGRFNVNNLVDEDGQVVEKSLEQFRRLLNALGLDPRYAGLTADWIDSNFDASFPDGAEDAIYTSRLPPYRTANQTLSSVSELAAIEGMDRATFRILEPHIVALPGRTAINVNTATPAVLQSLSENLTTGDVESLIKARESGGFVDMEGSFSALVTPEVLQELSESSGFFRLKVIVRIDTVRITLYSVLQRVANTGTVTPILRSLGTT